MAKTITITIPRDPNGKGVTIEVDGVSGSSCTKLTERLEQAFGEVKSREEKPEFFETAQQGEQNLELQ